MTLMAVISSIQIFFSLQFLANLQVDRVNQQK